MKIVINSYAGVVHEIENVHEVAVDDLREYPRFLALLDEASNRIFAIPLTEIRAIHYQYD